MNSQALREGRGTSESKAPSIVRDVLRSPGHALEPRTRASMESHFGRDFSGVRVHADDKAARSAEAMNARAYTHGNHIAFGKGPRDRGLLEHELTHVVQQMRGERTVQCASVCDTYDFTATKATIDSQLATYQADPKNVAAHQAVVRAVKMVRRCGTPAQVTEIETKVGTAIWAESATPLGGYTGLYPGYASGMSGKLKDLGATETLSTGYYKAAFLDPTVAPGDQTSKQRGRSKSTAKAMVDELERTDIIYFMGHHYGRYRAPGAFALATRTGDPKNETLGFDLRYIEKVGGFPKVKVMISTACATLCKEAFEIFHGLFPNAALLGYRGGAPLDGGAVRKSFDAKLQAIGPLMLEQAADIGSIVSAWKDTVAAIHKGQTGQKAGYYDGAKMEYWDGSAWKSIVPTDATNKCPADSAHDYRQNLPAPSGRVTPPTSATPPARTTCAPEAGEADAGTCE